MRLIGYYSATEYRIVDVDTNIDIYSAGNSKYDSQQYVAAEDGVGIDCMKKYAEKTGREIAKERGGLFLGVEEIQE